MTVPTGPFDTEAQARAAAQAAADPGLMPIKAAGNRKLLGRVCEAAGVAMGQYDDRIAEWLSIWEPSTVVVVAGWVSRARPPCIVFTAGQESLVAQALADAEGWRRLQADQWCAYCEAAPEGACQQHLDDLDLADTCRDLAATLARSLPQPRDEGRDA